MQVRYLRLLLSPSFAPPLLLRGYWGGGGAAHTNLLSSANPSLCHHSVNGAKGGLPSRQALAFVWHPGIYVFHQTPLPHPLTVHASGGSVLLSVNVGGARARKKKASALDFKLGGSPDTRPQLSAV
jgi:hypothetical protein